MNSFQCKKEAILTELSKPTETYSDRSPKGSVDPQIRSLVDAINSYDSLVTTSSCSGRISIFVDGCKESLSRAGGKGFGGKWLFVSHEPLSHDKAISSLHRLFDLKESQSQANEAQIDPAAARFIHFKFEPMVSFWTATPSPASRPLIDVKSGHDEHVDSLLTTRNQILHVLAANATIANHVLVAALQAGLRESGASSLDTGRAIESFSGSEHGKVQMPIPIAIRTTGAAFDNIIGFAGENTLDSSTFSDVYCSLVTEQYLELLVTIANQKFTANNDKMRRFDVALQDRLNNASTKEAAWEDTATRKARKRQEGLQRRQQVSEMRKSTQSRYHDEISPEISETEDIALGIH